VLLTQLQYPCAPYAIRSEHVSAYQAAAQKALLRGPALCNIFFTFITRGERPRPAIAPPTGRYSQRHLQTLLHRNL